MDDADQRWSPAIDRRRDELLRYRAELLEIRAKQLDFYDKAVKILAAVFFCLSAAALGNHGGLADQVLTGLFVGCAGFFMSFVLSLSSHLTSFRNADNHLAALDAALLSGEEPFFENRWLGAITAILNIAALLFFTLGLVALLLPAAFLLAGGAL